LYVLALENGLAATVLTQAKFECQQDHLMNRITVGYVGTCGPFSECNTNLSRVVCIFDMFDLTPKRSLFPAVMSRVFCDKWQRCGRTRMSNVFWTTVSTYFSLRDRQQILAVVFIPVWGILNDLLSAWGQNASTANIFKLLINYLRKDCKFD